MQRFLQRFILKRCRLQPPPPSEALRAAWNAAPLFDGYYGLIERPAGMGSPPLPVHRPAPASLMRRWQLGFIIAASSSAGVGPRVELPETQSWRREEAAWTEMIF